tara:strand:+ start:3146 stop:3397 length:252 start_codon:yes stop_codon:yes gene_type:complete
LDLLKEDVVAKQEPKYKHDPQYIYREYKKAYRKADMEKANYYNNISLQVHGTDLNNKFHESLARKEERDGVYGIGKSKKLRYG